jgi:hypothetical protein
MFFLKTSKGAELNNSILYNTKMMSETEWTYCTVKNSIKMFEFLKFKVIHQK